VCNICKEKTFAREKNLLGEKVANQQFVHIKSVLHNLHTVFAWNVTLHECPREEIIKIDSAKFRNERTYLDLGKTDY
jgi:hypothetical protein